MTNTMTPYAAAKQVNNQLAELGIEKVLPPQMIYTYVTKGYIKSVTVDGKKRVTAEALATWFVGYVNKTTKKVTATPEPSPWNFGDLNTEDTDTDVDPEEEFAVEAEFGTDDE
jgi:hypothetical protein